MGNVDLRPDHASAGGGLVDDFDGTITDMRFIMTDYEGSMSNAVPACHVIFDVEGEEANVMYSVGGKDDFAPDETGRGLTSLKSKSTLTKTCKFIMFMDSLVESGFPLNRLDPANISPVIGLHGHFLRKVVEYKGLKKGERDNTVLLCTKVITLPGEGKAAAKKGKGKGKAVDAELADTVAELIQTILIEKDGEAPKTAVLSAFFKHEDVKALPNKKEAVALASDDTFLGSRDEWTYEGGVLKM